MVRYYNGGSYHRNLRALIMLITRKAMRAVRNTIETKIRECVGIQYISLDFLDSKQLSVCRKLFYESTFCILGCCMLCYT